MSKPLPQNLSRDPVSGTIALATDPAQVWQALAQAAAALHAAASAMAQGNVVPIGQLPTLSPPTTPPPDGCRVIDLINKFLMAKARAGRSDRYLRTLRVSLLSFGQGRRHQDAAAVKVEDLERWLSASGWKPRTQRGYLSDVRVLYNFGIKRNLVAANPAAAVELPEEPSPPPGIHTPDQVAKALAFARAYDPNICRAIAIRYFAGLRSAEVDRLEEFEISSRFIEVTAKKAKTRARRLVTIHDNLAAWLALGGKLPLHDVNNRWRWFTAELLAGTQVPWPNNVTRHSFISYHLARWKNAGDTALEAGNSEAMVFRHYRELVTPDQAGEYFAIMP